MAKGLKLKVKTFCGPNTTFVRVTGEKLVGGFSPYHPPPPPHSSILKRVNGTAIFTFAATELLVLLTNLDLTLNDLDPVVSMSSSSSLQYCHKLPVVFD